VKDPEKRTRSFLAVARCETLSNGSAYASKCCKKKQMNLPHTKTSWCIN
jgi:hypothetical protein